MWSMPSLPGSSSMKAPMGMMRTTLPVYSWPTSTPLAMPSMILRALAAASESGVAMKTLPSSSMSILTPVSAMILLMTFPPEPMTSRILSGLMEKVMILGAHLESSGRGSEMVSSILPMMCMRPS